MMMRRGLIGGGEEGEEENRSLPGASTQEEEGAQVGSPDHLGPKPSGSPGEHRRGSLTRARSLTE